MIVTSLIILAFAVGFICGAIAMLFLILLLLHCRESEDEPEEQGADEDNKKENP